MGCCSQKQVLSHTQKQIQIEKEETVVRSQSTKYIRSPISEPDNLSVMKFPASQQKIATEKGKGRNNSRQNQVLKELLQDFQKCKLNYSEHDIDQAHHYATRCTQKYNQYKSLVGQGEIKNTEEYFTLINQVQEQYKDVKNYEQSIKMGGWTEQSNKAGVKISTRREDTTVGVLVQAELNESFQILISVLIEMDLYKNFMPFIKISRQEKVVARNCRIGYTENHFPVVSIRQAFFQGIGYNRLNYDKTLFLCTRSIHNREDLQKKLGYTCKVNPKNVQLEYRYFILLYQPISKGKGKMTLAMNIDTKMHFIPMWLHDKITQDFANDFYLNLLKQSKNFKGSEWQKNVKENPALFDFFKNAIDKHLNKNRIK